MSVRAKFKVDAIERTRGTKQTGRKDERGNPVYEPAEMQTIKMSPVYPNGDENHENTKFWQATPSGELRLGTVNAAAAAEFELGAEYYIDFSKA